MAVWKRGQAGIRIEVELGGAGGVADGVEITPGTGDRDMIDADEAAFIGFRVVRFKGAGDLGAGQEQGLRQALAAGQQGDLGGFLDIGQSIEMTDGTSNPDQIAQLDKGQIPSGRKKVYAGGAVLDDDIEGGG